MKGEMKVRGKGAIFLIMMIVMLVVTSVPLTSYAAANPLDITVKQAFATSSAGADATFTYQLKPLESGNPLPAGSAADGYLFDITGTAATDIELPVYGQQGIYRYELLQVINAEKPGYTYDRRVYTIEIYADTAQSAEVIVYNQQGEKEGSIEFQNSYHILPSDPALMTDPLITKTVSGHPGHPSTFEFKLVAEDAFCPMPAGSVNGVKTIKITGSGQSELGTWSYDKADTYYYTVYEVNTGISGYTYDTTVYTITDTVKEENGQCIVARIVTNDLKKPVATCAFTNTFNGNKGPASVLINQLSQGKGLPKTGDNLRFASYITLCALGVVLAAGMTLHLSAGARRKEATQRREGARG